MSGFDSPNWTQIPNDLFDYWLSRMSDAELRCVLAILRMTVGYHRADARLSLRQIRRMTGLSESSTRRGLEDAEAHGLILRHQIAGYVTVWTINIPAYREQSRYWTDPAIWTLLDRNNEGRGVKTDTTPLSNLEGEGCQN